MKSFMTETNCLKYDDWHRDDWTITVHAFVESQPVCIQLGVHSLPGGASDIATVPGSEAVPKSGARLSRWKPSTAWEPGNSSRSPIVPLSPVGYQNAKTIKPGRVVTEKRWSWCLRRRCSRQVSETDERDNSRKRH